MPDTIDECKQESCASVAATVYMGARQKKKAELADVPDLAMNCKDKGSDVQEEHSIHGLIGQAVEPPHMKHMRHRQHLHSRTDKMSASEVFSYSQRRVLKWQSSL
jgi:hypothetical protein